MSIFSNFSFNLFNPTFSAIKSTFNFSSLRSMFWGSSSLGSSGLTWGGSEIDPTPKFEPQEPITFVAQDYGIQIPGEKSEPTYTEPMVDYGIVCPKDTIKELDPVMLANYGIMCPKDVMESKAALITTNYGIVCYIDVNHYN